MLTWPSTLPSFQSTPYALSTQPAVLTSDLPGEVSQRVLSHRAVYTVPVTLKLNMAQLPIAEHFLRDKCNEGADKFNGPFMDSSGELTTVMRLLSGAYKVTHDGHIATLTTTLEVFI